MDSFVADAGILSEGSTESDTSLIIVMEYANGLWN
jgi:hypothetical protein